MPLAPESVWDYPRPPDVVSDGREVRVVLGGETIAESDRALRVRETASPPVIYIPLEDVRGGVLSESGSPVTVCEWKGRACHFDAEAVGARAQRAAWGYPAPNPGYEELSGYIAFYPGRVDACYLGGERVAPQPGSYYGGWITADVEGPFKGEVGSEGW